ncbi:MAG: octanoyltransferase [Gemmatimonadota bacterium]|nr:octanoyltransferase [Gemmatimonadota bacterium]
MSTVTPPASAATAAGPGAAPNPGAAPAPVRWRSLVSPPLPGAANMAWDQALMARARRTGEAVLRVYAWAQPTLSLGRNQRARGAYDLDRAAARGVAIVRRPTGGRALLHHHEVTYSVTAPEAFDPTLRGAYTRINDLLLRALRALGVDAELARPAGRTLAPGLAPCFDEPSAGEVVVGGRKLVGSAQWRHDGALLQHGSILRRDDQGLIGALMVRPPSAPTPAAATLEGALGADPGFDPVARALLDALGAAAPGVTPLDEDDALRADVAAWTRTFLGEDWTWRR